MNLLLAILLFLGGINEAHWRWRKNDGPEARATWRESQDFPGTIVDAKGIRLRVEVSNTGKRAEAGIVGLQYRKDSSDAWVFVSDSSYDFVMAGSNPWMTDGEATTCQISDSGTFAGGRVFVRNRRGRDTLQPGTRKEYEWCLRPTVACAKNRVYQFRVSFGGLRLGTPLLMVRSGPPESGAVYRDTDVTAFFSRDTGWIASDGCFSIPLSDGRVLWNMGDSYINHYNATAGTLPCLFQVRNAALLQSAGDWNPAGTNTLVGEGIHNYYKNDPDDNHLLWPNAGYQRGDTVYVYCMNIMNASGGLGFARGGNDCMAKIVLPGLRVVGYDSLDGFNGVTFGLGFDTTEPGDYIYSWGVKSAYITSNIFVARFPRNNTRAPWTFWNGAAWDTSAAHLSAIATGASNSIFVAKVGNKFVLVSTEFSVGCDAGTRIYVASGDRPTGPFSTRKVLYTIPDNVLGHTPFFYGPVLHPEYINSRNEILLTYDINGYGNCSPFCINNSANPDYYRPRGIRVPLKLIDSSIINK
jgi:hypothetical protein